MGLLEFITTTIHENGPMPFVNFMQTALYDPKGGYYTTNVRGIGSSGDFITAPELTPLFGQTLANQIHQLFASLKNPVILEFGAGSGRLCIDILTRLKALDCLPEAYFILEVSAHLKQTQQTAIQDALPWFADRVYWLSKWPEKSFQGVILANEVLDAMPVHRFLNTADGLLESFVTLQDGQNHSVNQDTQKPGLQEIFLPCQDKRLIEHLVGRLPQQHFPYLSEANLWIEGWLAEHFKALEKGAILLIDYGFPEQEYYHPDRNQGTLMCHYQHHAHIDPFIHIGQQDITAHVNFSYIAQIAHQLGFRIAGYTNQAAFLLANDILNLQLQLNESLERSSQALKCLLQPSEMGELFKVMALTKALDIDLNGFQLRDKRVSL